MLKKGLLILSLAFVLSLSGCAVTSASEAQTDSSSSAETALTARESSQQTTTEISESTSESQPSGTTETAKEENAVSNQQTAVPMIRLNDGTDMPACGLGTWTLDDDAAENSVYHFLMDEGRLIDTAYYYGNEVGVGRGIQKAIAEGIVTREEVYVTSKVAPWYSDYDQKINEILTALNLEYVDLMLIHESGSGEFDLYRALEQGVRDGRIRTLGISNYYTPEEYDRITEGAEILPAVIQNENHIYYQNTALQEYVAKDGVIVESYYPFGGRGAHIGLHEQPCDHGHR
ncbi:MAG: aldo/keto reductase [Eubacteriales bacterium]|nr:aldo/keto reductase [Eubacteriales bacterium]